ncbi:hypothetical protein [Pedobacter jamesrossensis]|uniref:Uncharacterized protein n=1 Tax=Pedobacter jamesrossensis TaxID=1908238 RepID=A0ABV8NRE2_9SPHI
MAIIDPKKKNHELKQLLVKVKQLRGFGDMDTYRLASTPEIYQNSGAANIRDKIIEEFSDPITYSQARKRLIVEIESQIGTSG